MRKIQVTVYQFDELPTEKAKEKAREWFRSLPDDDWFRPAYEDMKECLSLCGFTVDQIFFSGFSSQGDGACFEGGWKAEDVKPGKLKELAPEDKELNRIASRMESLAEKRKSAWMRVKHSGHYYHEHCTEFDIGDTTGDFGDEELPGEDVDDIKETSKDAMRWIYKRLMEEWEYQNADAQVDETIRANEYEFTEDGKRFTGK